MIRSTFLSKQQAELKLGIIGLGYVGLPLAVEFARGRSVVAYDINSTRVNSLKNGKDTTGEISKDELKRADGLHLTSNHQDLKDCNCYIVTVPTPIDEFKKPDLGPLLNASEEVGRLLTHGDLVIYESTVYPGCTEEDCVPVLERASSLSYNTDFFCGYSPERINPGDTAHRLPDIIKITSGSTGEAADLVDHLYSSIISAGTYKAESIRTAEAAKVIENTQRDLNIALVNELAIIFDKMEIDIHAVLRAAGTKWNFLSFEPGLVGGHCIGVDPYYLTHKAQQLGMNPDVILAGRRTNDGMAHYVAERIMRLLHNHYPDLPNPEVAVLGISFKENCSDLRNSQAINLIKYLISKGCRVSAYDPIVDSDEANSLLGRVFVSTPPENIEFDCIVLAVPHLNFLEGDGCSLDKNLKQDGFIFDLKARLPMDPKVISL